MEDDWEALADKEIVVPVKMSNKWVGEDVDDDVKESWEDEEKKDEEKVEPASIATQKPKISKSKLAEQERLRAEEEAKRLENMTPEEKIAEKLRLQKLQMESDLNFALDTFSAGSHSIDGLQPSSKEEFKEYGSKLNSKVSQFKESPHFPQFIEDLVRNLCVHLSAADVKKVKITVESLHSEKLKQEKQQSKKAVGKNKLKVSLRTDNDEVYDFDQDFQDDYDDFM